MTGVALRFSANLNFMFLEAGSFLDRYRAAKRAGFDGVEGPFPPAEISVDELVAVQKETGLKQILMNIALGDVPGGQLGCAALPGWESEFLVNLNRTIEYAKAVGCRKIHIMAGKLDGPGTEVHDRTYLANLRVAAPILERNNIIGVIEPINKHSVPGYYLACYDKATKMITSVGSANVKLMLDIFHAQHIRGDITNSIRALTSYIGHVQLAQVPGRNEPDTDGELNFRYILHVLATEGRYADGWVGCEYRPLTDTASGLNWLRDFGYWQ
ncbi:putative hydroxypyruvate isomerase [Anopheles moucheti]|uniref:putative hydroxypyruvate isomerase n=1 Tax=Anopheles moucheti TaxID=186751 RepID=UPI0022F0E000|nr:putative hydroxypyruvate isomerase [Anopheles moucheti]XP_052888889.1 putative hydroxypyruvate isomerase [Anopheles moucheti]